MSHVPADRRASVLSTLADGGGHSLLHVAVARLHVPLARLLLGMVRVLGREEVGEGELCPGLGQHYKCPSSQFS